jgi:hypothetical protein
MTARRCAWAKSRYACSRFRTEAGTRNPPHFFNVIWNRSGAAERPRAVFKR